MECQVEDNVQVSVNDGEKEHEESQNENNSLIAKRTRGRPKKNALEKKPLICDVCQRVLSSPTKLIIHKRTHTGEKPYSCPHCDARFARKDKLTNHIRCHTGEKNHVCHICFKSFVVGHKLNMHMKSSHDGIKPFSCPYCASKFSRKDKLQMHIRIHTGFKPYACPYCPLAKFSRKDKFIAHFKLHHPEEVIPQELLKLSYNKSIVDSKGREDHGTAVQDDESLREISDSNEFPSDVTPLPPEYESNENSPIPERSQSINNGLSPLVHSIEKSNRSSSKTFKCHVCKLLFATEMVLAQHLLKAH